MVAAPVAAIAGPHKGVVGPLQPATSVVVSGKLLTYEGQPAANQPIHFENLVSGDLFLAQTGQDGSFSFPLPPGEYDLRVEQGPIVVNFIDADTEARSRYGWHRVRAPQDPILAASRRTCRCPDLESGTDHFQRIRKQSILSDQSDTTGGLACAPGSRSVRPVPGRSPRLGASRSGMMVVMGSLLHLGTWPPPAPCFAR